MLIFSNAPLFQELDLAENALTSLPSQLFALKQLRKLDLSFNRLERTDVVEEGAFEALEVLNVSGNELTALPDGLTRSCLRLQRLYASFNKLTFEGCIFLKFLSLL
jgi:Leucine-rich repeat (LRR) protein